MCGFQYTRRVTILDCPQSLLLQEAKLPVYKILVLCLSLLLCLGFERSSCYGDPPELESAEECPDWFLANWSTLNNKYACAGEAKLHNNSNQQVVMEWFEVRFVEPKERKIYHYIESIKLYDHSGDIDPWEKWMRRGEDYFWSLGEYSEKLKPSGRGKDGQLLLTSDGQLPIGVVRQDNVPEPFTYSVLSASMYGSKSNLETVNKIFSESEVLESEQVADGAHVGFFAFRNGGIEILFDPKFNYMPTKSRGFFRKDFSGNPRRDAYSLLHFESRTKWEKLGTDTFVPSAITNFVHRFNPKSKQSKTLDLRVAWSIDNINKDVFSDDSMEQLREDEGALAKMKSDLLAKLKDIDLPTGEK